MANQSRVNVCVRFDKIWSLKLKCKRKLVHVSNCVLFRFCCSFQCVYHFPCYHLVREENRKEIDRIVSNFICIHSTHIYLKELVRARSISYVDRKITENRQLHVYREMSRVAIATSNKLKFGVKFCPILRKCHVIHTGVHNNNNGMCLNFVVMERDHTHARTHTYNVILSVVPNAFIRKTALT